ELSLALGVLAPAQVNLGQEEVSAGGVLAEVVLGRMNRELVRRPRRLVETAEREGVSRARTLEPYPHEPVAEERAREELDDLREPFIGRARVSQRKATQR